uniref:Uncharacterized protein n=1 Tax=Rhizophora mucronata TaxID=61149 RepID=A0A2P2NM76_RHIMU
MIRINLGCTFNYNIAVSFYYYY